MSNFSWCDFNSHPLLKGISPSEVRRLMSIDIRTGVVSKLETFNGKPFDSYFSYLECALDYTKQIPKEAHFWNS